MPVVNVTHENFDAEVKQASVPVVIDFWAPWCGPCKMMGPVFEELSNDYDGKLKFVKVNTEEDQTLPASFAVQGIPTLVILKEGKEVDRHVGFAPKEALKQKLDQHVG